MINIRFAMPGSGLFKDIPFTQWKFPAGEIGVALQDDFLKGVSMPADPYKVYINFQWEFESAEEIALLANLVDAVKSVMPLEFKPELTLTLKYIPYARQDRRVNAGESHALKVFTEQLNALKFEQVLVVDPHSDVATALIDNVSVITQDRVIRPLLKTGDFKFVIAPDAGAAKKIYKSTKGLPVEVLVCEKTRDANGNITSLHIPATKFTEDDKFIVIDDICDGGATFLALAQQLNVPKNQVSLFVTHGIFSRGVDALLGSYGEVISHNLMCNESDKARFEQDKACPSLFVVRG